MGILRDVGLAILRPLEEIAQGFLEAFLGLLLIEIVIACINRGIVSHLWVFVIGSSCDKRCQGVKQDEVVTELQAIEEVESICSLFG